METTTEPPEEKFAPAKVLIGPLHTVTDDGDNGVIIGVHSVRVITINGQIWEKKFMPFGLDEAGVMENWRLGKLENWTRIQPNE